MVPAGYPVGDLLQHVMYGPVAMGRPKLTTPPTRCRHGHDLTNGGLYVSPGGKRSCLICRRKLSRDYARRRSEAGFTQTGGWTALGWLTSLTPGEKRLLVRALVEGGVAWKDARQRLDLERKIEPPRAFRGS